MEWPDSLPTASELFPSLYSNPAPEGVCPTLPESEAVFTFLQPENPKGLKAQLLSVLERFQSSPQNPNDSGATIDEALGKVIVESSARIEIGAHLIGPCYVGPKAEIRHGAYVRPYSWICAGAVVGHASETKHTVLLPGAKAPHFNYVGDSILGKGVNLGAGTKISNLRNDGGEVQLRIDGKRIGSGLRKFGAVLGEGCQLGCNSVTNPGVMLGCDSVVWPNMTVTGVHGSNSKHR
ncbi:MAG: glucose-1-phosphate thymidylyltransferase [Euryarchaeota archaeon]|jgi:NDP-sugar pyrophosphorylase family protein|nr:glucose-1-phosphate thymidylyltransferase [Euryarchaeota archaeon]MBT5844599.1 glucose-1-phosphate thymidylyltransferase [Euryarchaeota archaeon]MBT6640713.1 glucose-1-phosphate thymidylyltransferase [Euryarchaeota archaeon]MBT6844308.1 glucose-1-phosphate thymidylyltransferase [Euryarchaeota archaeon]MBT7064600.1 glucose-1-phosphate thymidylyltransferase [Euryarchaeota archaeon]